MAGTVEIVVAVVGRPHGVRGEVSLTLRTDEPERRLGPGQNLLVEGSRRALRIASRSWSAGHLFVSFEGVGDRTSAEELRGAVLLAEVPAEETPEHDDEYYDRQLVGLDVRDAQGTSVGTIGEVLHMPAQDLLSVRTDAGARLVPFVSALVPLVDLAQGFVQLADVPGLVDDRAIDDGSGGGE
ncbi:16S rRNA processing protein RimM [Propionibacterium cyclohexanicum]|uniref:Ribosome maturation factor RimM n=1 Tax=Propionibacterium cyclohexanicum TaxID=64702 RepID=A0A1H9PQM9_9ACTN|nr:ribosome maturation factor RimM [Propionibacterium cyclohexanicum]SER50504.1 16S rRNA processing protein RimM [Propionibacterium cyclohexanicum]